MGHLGLSPRQLFFREIRKDRLAIASFWFIVALVVIAAGAPLVSRYVVHHAPAHSYIDALNSFGNPAGPNGHFWFGVDTAGRDVFVRILYGARTSLFVAVFATLCLLSVAPVWLLRPSTTSLVVPEPIIGSRTLNGFLQAANTSRAIPGAIRAGNG